MRNPDAPALHRQRRWPDSRHCGNRLEDNVSGGLKGGYSQQDPSLPPDPAGVASLPASPSCGGGEPTRDTVGPPNLTMRPLSTSLGRSVANLFVKTSSIERLGFPQLRVLNTAGKSWAREVTARGAAVPRPGAGQPRGSETRAACAAQSRGQTFLL